jgi:hypothetical protein
MRRRLVLVLATVVLLALGGCGFGPASATAGRAMINTSWMCDALNEVLSNGATAFGDYFGAMLERQADGDWAGTDGSRAIAQRELNDLATDLQIAARAANDPVLVAAVFQAADNLNRLAFDQSLLLGVQTLDDVAAVSREITVAVYPLTALCP